MEECPFLPNPQKCFDALARKLQFHSTEKLHSDLRAAETLLGFVQHEKGQQLSNSKRCKQ